MHASVTPAPEPRKAERRRAVVGALTAAALRIAQLSAAEAAPVDALLREILTLAVDALEAHSGALILPPDRDWYDLAPHAAGAEGHIHVRADGIVWQARRPGSAVEHALAQKQAVYVADIGHSPFGPHRQRRANGQLAFAVVPLRSAERVYGALVINFAQPTALAPEEREALERFADHAAVALQGVRLVAAEQRRADQAEQFATTLSRVGAAADLERALEELVRGAVDVLRGEYGSAQLFATEQDQGMRLIRTKAGAIERRLASPGLPGSFSAAIREGGPATLVRDYWALDPTTYPVYDRLREQERRSAVYAPIDAGKRRIGSFHVDHSQPDFFTVTDLAIAEALAAQAGAVIERARQETERARNYRLKALGELASGVAHDFNNTLALILGHADILASDPALPPHVRRGIDAIRTGAESGAAGVRRLQEFARIRRDRPMGAVAPAALLEEAAQLTRPRWQDEAQRRGVPIQLVVEVPPGLPEVQGDRAELQEALANLIFNAVDAMPAGGTIRLRALLPKGPERDGDPRLAIEISDTGMGIEESVQARIFDPFFTTKGEAGNGLGLSMVYGTVQRHNGVISVRSAPGKGTTFRLLLPAAKPAEGQADPVAAAPASGETPGIRILAVDDQVELLQMLGAMLRAEGHQVTTCSAGSAAIAAFEAALDGRDPPAFDLVLSDLSMPDMSGWDVARQVKQRAPAVPVALVTGWGSQLDLATHPDAGVDLVVAKPYRAATLRRTVAEAMALGNAVRSLQPAVQSQLPGDQGINAPATVTKPAKAG